MQGLFTCNLIPHTPYLKLTLIQKPDYQTIDVNL